ncbi:unnamed protein product [Ixodes pacificus]
MIPQPRNAAPCPRRLLDGTGYASSAPRAKITLELHPPDTGAGDSRSVHVWPPSFVESCSRAHEHAPSPFESGRAAHSARIVAATSNPCRCAMEKDVRHGGTACAKIKRWASPCWEQNTARSAHRDDDDGDDYNSRVRPLPPVSAFLNNRFSSTLASSSAGVGASAGAAVAATRRFHPATAVSALAIGGAWAEARVNVTSPRPGSISRRRLLSANSRRICPIHTFVFGDGEECRFGK